MRATREDKEGIRFQVIVEGIEAVGCKIGVKPHRERHRDEGRFSGTTQQIPSPR